MSEERPQCQALTKGGDQCRNRALEGSDYCGTHATASARVSEALQSPPPKSRASAKDVAPSPSDGRADLTSPSTHEAADAQMEATLEAVKTAPSGDVPDLNRSDVRAAAVEINKIAEEVRKSDPKYTPPPFSPEALKKVLSANLDILAKYLPLDLARDILRNLEGTKPSDLFDPETWKGLWYILNYTAQAQAKGLSEEALRRLSALPGMDLVTQFGMSVYESPRDLLDMETWKGAAVIANAALQANVSALKRKLTGGQDE
jgi:hypothetical protein